MRILQKESIRIIAKHAQSYASSIPWPDKKKTLLYANLLSPNKQAAQATAYFRFCSWMWSCLFQIAMSKHCSQLTVHCWATYKKISWEPQFSSQQTGVSMTQKITPALHSVANWNPYGLSKGRQWVEGMWKLNDSFSPPDGHSNL